MDPARPPKLELKALQYLKPISFFFIKRPFLKIFHLPNSLPFFPSNVNQIRSKNT